MADSERERIEHFRQRWAQDHFRTSNSSIPVRSSHQPRTLQNGRSNVAAQDLELSEVNSPQPASRSSSRFDKFRQRSWRENLGMRSTENRLAPVGAPEPTPTGTNTSIHSSSSSYVMDTFTNEEAIPSAPASNASRPVTADRSSPDPSAWLTELYTLSYLTFFALLGTLARVGTEALTQYPGAPVTSRVLWANVGGSFVMGFLVEDRVLFGIPNHLESNFKQNQETSNNEAKIHATHLKHKKTLPLYVGLSTGFCGCYTSFSSFIRDAFLALTNALETPSPTTPYRAAGSPSHRNAGFSFLALLSILILHPALSLAALKTGAHCAVATRQVLHHRIFPPRLLNVLNPAMLIIGFGCWLGALFLTIFPPASGPSPVDWRARATIPLLFAPPGCILRFYLAKWMNRPSTPHFPYGTFIANVFGTFVLGMAWDLQHARSIGASLSGGNACAVLLGVQEGFCGCLTTVSTWVLELSGLGRRWAWWYGSVSVAVSFAGMVIIMGGMGWTVGFAAPVCG